MTHYVKYDTKFLFDSELFNFMEPQSVHEGNHQCYGETLDFFTWRPNVDVIEQAFHD